MLKVGFQGKNGTYSDLAVDLYFAKQKIQKYNYANFLSIVEDIENNKLDYALIPVENTTTGIISRTYDFFFKHQLYAVGEICLPIKEQLIGLANSDIEKIKEVYSHPEALGQCANFFAKYPHIKQIPYQDTSASVAYVKACNDPSKAALASVNAATYYDMAILASDVQDSDHNTTRFLCITHHYEKIKDANKISTMFILKHEAGSLYRLLEVFAKRGINLLKLESRPLPQHQFEYLFYLDFEARLNEEELANLLQETMKYCIDHKLLGHYQAYKM
ncbi:MAG: prephenate dehydratase [Erysipelotrichaceae bacterium]|nr:prephenate dehydratase [Erysipelotrichaceae bacterium]MDY5252623.1 prephenate dehydratase [Erysipelotrichaceae bacterium]